jgi:hypothetical protein
MAVVVPTAASTTIAVKANANLTLPFRVFVFMSIGPLIEDLYVINYRKYYSAVLALGDYGILLQV